jgi:hypothetical protein
MLKTFSIFRESSGIGTTEWATPTFSDLALTRASLTFNTSTQATSRYTTRIEGLWYQLKVNASYSRWKIVISHDGPYTSETNNRPWHPWMQWPWDTHGVDLVLTGDSHVYERLVTTSGSTPIITTGWGGKDLRAFGTALNSGDGATSLVRYNSKFGAVFLTVSRNELKAEAYTVDNDKIDELILTKS